MHVKHHEMHVKHREMHVKHHEPLVKHYEKLVKIVEYSSTRCDICTRCGDNGDRKGNISSRRKVSGDVSAIVVLV